MTLKRKCCVESSRDVCSDVYRRKEEMNAYVNLVKIISALISADPMFTQYKYLYIEFCILKRRKGFSVTHWGFCLISVYKLLLEGVLLVLDLHLIDWCFEG